MSREYDDDDVADRPIKKTPMGPLDGMFRDTSIVILLIFACCCNYIALILSAVAYFTAKDEKAKSNALVTLIVAAIIAVLATLGQIARVMMAAGHQGGGF